MLDNAAGTCTGIINQSRNRNSGRSHLVLVTVCLTIMTKCRVISTQLIIPDQPPLRYIRLGDLNLGGIISGLGYDPTGLCGNKPFMNSSFHFSEAIAYAIDEVNKNETLGNVTLGFAILDDCTKESTAGVQALSFIKQVSRSVSEDFTNSTGNETTLAEEDAFRGDLLPSYDVVGVIGCIRSSSSQSAALILGAAQVPLISFTSTSENLNNKELYPYFLRVMPSDNTLVNIHIELLRHFGWRYISVVYEEGDYGETAYETLRSQLASASETICLATSVKIYRKFTYSDYLLIMKGLIGHKNARVVVVYADPPHVLPLLKASYELGAQRWFVWLGSASWKSALGDINDQNMVEAAAGSIVAGFQSSISERYNQHVLKMDPRNNLNPWFARFWEDTFKCSLSDPACISGNKVSSLPGSTTFTNANNAFNAVLAYVYGIRNVINDKCPNVTRSNVRDCITGPDLLQAMLSYSFHGFTGLIEFDHLGSALAKFHVEQIIPTDDLRRINVTHVATFYTGKSKMSYIGNITFDYIVQDGFRDGIPESVCSKPCGPGETIIPREMACCWECRKCRNNEIVVNDFTDCFICPPYQWPDPKSNFTICEPITPYFPQPNEPIVILCLVLSIIGVVGVVLVTLAFIKHRNAPIIKASSRELSYIKLLAVLTGYITMLVLCARPSNDVCNLTFFMYCISFTMLYAPLLVKSIRIHRIFTSGKKSTAKVKFTSPRSQIGFTFMFISVQIFLCTVAATLYKPKAHLTHAVRTEMYVELSCDWTLPGLGSFLVYNIVLIFLCSVFAFRTRKLPDNFSESRFISVCVYTTLIVWAAFVPTYFTSSRQFLKTLLLALSLMVNHTVAVTFLFIPKIYAAVNLIQTTIDSATSADDNPRRGSAVASINNSRFLSGLSEVLAALRVHHASSELHQGPEVETVSPEHRRPSQEKLPRKKLKVNLSKVCPVESQDPAGDEGSSKA